SLELDPAFDEIVQEFIERAKTRGSCPCSLRLIPAVGKPGKIPSFQHLYEGVLPWFPISFSTSWCSSPWCGCASCSSGCGQATVLLLTRHHLNPRHHGALAAASRNPLRASPASRTATPVSTPPPLARNP